VAGSADHVAAALAAGLTTSGDVLLKFGGAGDILYCAERPDPDPHFYFDYHDIPGLTLIIRFCSFRWQENVSAACF